MASSSLPRSASRLARWSTGGFIRQALGARSAAKSATSSAHRSIARLRCGHAADGGAAGGGSEPVPPKGRAAGAFAWSPGCARAYLGSSCRLISVLNMKWLCVVTR